jgi:integrase
VAAHLDRLPGPVLDFGGRLPKPQEEDQGLALQRGRQLGHASLATTQRYLDHIVPKEVIETMQARTWAA